MVYVDWRIALAIIVSSFLVVAGPRITGRIVADKRLVYQNQMVEYVNRITDILNGYKLVNRITGDYIVRVHEDTLCTTADRRFAYGKSKTVSLSINEIATRIIQIVSFICAISLLMRKLFMSMR